MDRDGIVTKKDVERFLRYNSYQGKATKLSQDLFAMNKYQRADAIDFSEYIMKNYEGYSF